MSRNVVDLLATGVLLELPGIEDAAVVRRQTTSGSEELVAYVVPSGLFSPEAIQQQAEWGLRSHHIPVTCVGVSILPTLSDGSVDVNSLCALPVVDAALAAAAEHAVREFSGFSDAVASVTHASHPHCDLSLSDLVAESAAAVRKPTSGMTEVTGNHGLEKTSSTGRLSVSHGGPLRSELPANLAECLQLAASRFPEHGITYVRPDGSEFYESYPALLAHAECAVAGLRKAGLKPGEHVIFQLDEKADFVAAFWACVLGGFIPAPISVPASYQDYNAVCSKLHGCWLALGKPVILTRAGLADDISELRRFAPDFAEARILAIEELQQNRPDSDRYPAQLNDLALILFTSGSTGRPKGVRLSHKNVIARSLATAEMNAFTSHDVSLNWFPLDHVGGIVMFHVMYTVAGANQVEVSTQWVLERPLRWLDLAEKHAVTVTWAPNFAFGLINSEEQTVLQRRWNLSRLRFVLNGGEAVVPSTALRFLDLLAPSELPPTAMRPAWGMSETSSGMLFSDRCKAGDYGPQDQFVEVGTAIPGVSARIVDADDHPIAEGCIGPLQVTGLSVTDGYHDNPELNSESFTADGWFKTGDLACMRDGRISITGRCKDVIIVRGVNHYCHELESVVESAPGVAVSFTAATPVSIQGSDTDSFCIFFSPEDSAPETLPQVIDRIYSALARVTGLAPKYIIPLSQDQIPKTAIGKIQRSELRSRFELGDFDAIIEQVQRGLGKGPGVPDWFYRRVWKPREVRGAIAPETSSTVLVFADDAGLAPAFSSIASRCGSKILTVTPGPDFAFGNDGSYEINPSVPQHYDRLLEQIRKRGDVVDAVVHCWLYGSIHEKPSIQSIRAKQYLGTYGLALLVQAFERSDMHPKRLFVASSHAQPVLEHDRLAPERSTAVAFTASLALENERIDSRCIDLEGDPVVAVDSLAREIGLRSSAVEVAYRDGIRFEAFLEHVDMLNGRTAQPPISSGGLYLITGGLGGIGTELVRFLIETYNIKALVVGSTELPPEPEWDERSRGSDVIGERIRNYRRIRRTGGHFCYRPLDLSDAGSLRDVVSETESLWGEPLAGILHLAGAGNLKRHWQVMDDYWIRTQALDTFEWMFQPKVYATQALFELLVDRPDAIFVAFSSVNSLFGGATFSAYSAANRFLDSYCIEKRRQLGPRVHCLNWSIWDDLGMSAGAPEFGRKMARDLGYDVVDKTQGFYSLLAGICRTEAQLIVGLDGSNPNIRKRVANGFRALEQLSISCSGQGEASAVSVMVADRFGVQSQWSCTAAADGQRTVGDENQFEIRNFAEPRTELEQSLARIWRDVLHVSQIGVTEKLFELGGDSLVAIRLLNRIRETFKVDISLRTLFERPTIESLAIAIAAEQKEVSVADTPEIGEEPYVDSLTDEEVDLLLRSTVAASGGNR